MLNVLSHLHWPTGGQNHLTQNLFYNKVVSILCNIRNTVLKVKNRMVCGFGIG